MAATGSVVWPSATEDLWRFNWILDHSPDEEGTTITQAYYRGRKVFWKASLPSLRVQYFGGSCGPYKDPLNYTNARTTSKCPTSRVCLYSYVSNGIRGLGIDSYHRIGAYHLTQRWVFWEDGVIYARLYSAGLQCNYNHKHHAYWRFDFDIAGSASDLALEYNSYTGNEGWGNGWHPFDTEVSRNKHPSSQRSWAIMDKTSGAGYHLIPGPQDTHPANTFSNRDLWLMRYHGAEDRHGRQGSAYDDGLQAYLNGENIDGQDVVAWYCAHLYHQAHDGGDDWHGVGPNLIPFRNW